MKQKTSLHFFGLLLFLNFFYGCAGLQKEPIIKNYFDLDIQLPISIQNNFHTGKDLLVKEFFMSPAFDTHSFVYRTGENEYITDYYNEFINYPARLITEKITEILNSSSCFSLAVTHMEKDIPYRLSGKITKLYADFQKSDHPKAVIEIRILLEKRVETVFKTLLSTPYLMEEPIVSRKPSDLVAGWNKGLEKIAEQLIRDFQAKSP